MRPSIVTGLGLIWTAFAISACSADSAPRSSVTIPKLGSDAAAPTERESPPVSSKSPAAAKGEWRVITDVVATPLAIAWCPVEKDSCEQAYSAGPQSRLQEIQRSPDRQSLGFFVEGPESCQIFLCAEGSCGHPVDASCNPNNGSLTWLPFGSLLYRGGAGSGVSVAMLFSHDGGTLWASEHILDELSPSQRYLLVGANSKQDLFGQMDIVEVMNLVVPSAVETVGVPPGADVHAAWLGDRVKLTWEATTKEIKLLDTGTTGNDDGWRPFSQ